MDLYRIKSSLESLRYGLLAIDNEGYCYVYSANTGGWHRSHAREFDLAFKREAVYERIDTGSAERLIGGVKPADPLIMGRYIKELEQQPAAWKKSSADVGVNPPA